MPKIWVNQQGTWKQVKRLWVNVKGVWVDPKGGLVNDSGIGKQFYPDAVLPLKYTVPGRYYYTVPDGVSSLQISAQGGGGAGGGSTVSSPSSQQYVTWTSLETISTSSSSLGQTYVKGQDLSTFQVPDTPIPGGVFTLNLTVTGARGGSILDSTGAVAVEGYPGTTVQVTQTVKPLDVIAYYLAFPGESFVQGITSGKIPQGGQASYPNGLYNGGYGSAGLANPGPNNGTIYTYTSTTKTLYTVPAGITSITISATGGRGGNHTPQALVTKNTTILGNVGYTETKTISVTAGDVIAMYVGGKGADDTLTMVTPLGGLSTYQPPNYQGSQGGQFGGGGGGGAATVVTLNGSIIIVACGGNGAGDLYGNFQPAGLGGSPNGPGAQGLSKQSAGSTDGQVTLTVPKLGGGPQPTGTGGGGAVVVTINGVIVAAAAGGAGVGTNPGVGGGIGQPGVSSNGVLGGVMGTTDAQVITELFLPASTQTLAGKLPPITLPLGTVPTGTTLNAFNSTTGNAYDLNTYVPNSYLLQWVPSAPQQTNASAQTSQGSDGYRGEVIEGLLSVSPGDVLTIDVGGGGYPSITTTDIIGYTPAVPPSTNIFTAKFTASGNWTLPDNVTKLSIQAIGGGGGGGDYHRGCGSQTGHYGGKGGSGGSTTTDVTASLGKTILSGTSISFTVGLGGAAKQSGGATSVLYPGGSVSAQGGNPGQNGYPGNPGAAGTNGANNDGNVPNNGGVGGQNRDTDVDGKSGSDGSVVFTYTVTTPGIDPKPIIDTTVLRGDGGVSTTGFNGGKGSLTGITLDTYKTVRSTKYYTTPGTYTFTVPDFFSNLEVVLIGAGGGGADGGTTQLTITTYLTDTLSKNDFTRTKQLSVWFNAGGIYADAFVSGVVLNPTSNKTNILLEGVLAPGYSMLVQNKSGVTYEYISGTKIGFNVTSSSAGVYPQALGDDNLTYTIYKTTSTVIPLANGIDGQNTSIVEWNLTAFGGKGGVANTSTQIITPSGGIFVGTRQGPKSRSGIEGKITAPATSTGSGSSVPGGLSGWNPQSTPTSNLAFGISVGRGGNSGYTNLLNLTASGAGGGMLYESYSRTELTPGTNITVKIGAGGAAGGRASAGQAGAIGISWDSLVPALTSAEIPPLDPIGVINLLTTPPQDGATTAQTSETWSTWMNANAVWTNNILDTSFDHTYYAFFPRTGSFYYKFGVDNSATIYLDGDVLLTSQNSYATPDSGQITVSAGKHTIRVVASNTENVGGVAFNIWYTLDIPTKFSRGGAGGGGGGAGTVIEVNDKIALVAAGGGGGAAGYYGDARPALPYVNATTFAGGDGFNDALGDSRGNGAGGGGAGFNGGIGGPEIPAGNRFVQDDYIAHYHLIYLDSITWIDFGKTFPQTHAQLRGARPINVIPKTVIPGVLFDNTNSQPVYGILPLDPKWQLTQTIDSSFTIEAWVHRTGFGSHPTYGGSIISKDGDYIINCLPDGRIACAFNHGTNSPNWITPPVGVAVIPLNIPTHISVVVANKLLTIYINGVSVWTYSTLVRQPTASTNPVYIGHGNKLTHGWQGYIAKIKVYAYARNLDQVLSDYNSVIPNPTSSSGPFSGSTGRSFVPDITWKVSSRDTNVLQSYNLLDLELTNTYTPDSLAFVQDYSYFKGIALPNIGKKALVFGYKNKLDEDQTTYLTTTVKINLLDFSHLRYQVNRGTDIDWGRAPDANGTVSSTNDLFLEFLTIDSSFTATNSGTQASFKGSISAAPGLGTVTRGSQVSGPGITGQATVLTVTTVGDLVTITATNSYSNIVGVTMPLVTFSNAGAYTFSVSSAQWQILSQHAATTFVPNAWTDFTVPVDLPALRNASGVLLRWRHKLPGGLVGKISTWGVTNITGIKKAALLITNTVPDNGGKAGTSSIKPTAGTSGSVTITPNKGNYQTYYTPGTYTFTVPSGISSLLAVTVVGGGGGSAGTGGGGGWFPTTQLPNYQANNFPGSFIQSYGIWRPLIASQSDFQTSLYFPTSGTYTFTYAGEEGMIFRFDENQVYKVDLASTANYASPQTVSFTVSAGMHRIELHSPNDNRIGALALQIKGPDGKELWNTSLGAVIPGGAGGSGAVVENKILAVNPGDVLTIVVGAGGYGGNYKVNNTVRQATNNPNDPTNPNTAGINGGLGNSSSISAGNQVLVIAYGGGGGVNLGVGGAGGIPGGFNGKNSTGTPASKGQVIAGGVNALGIGSGGNWVEGNGVGLPGTGGFIEISW